MSQVIGNAIYAIPDMATDFAALFSTSATYAVGDFCIYQNGLYKCHTAVTNAGNWTGSTNWTATSVDDELDLKLNRSEVDSDLSGTSTNPVQNKKVKEALDLKANFSNLAANYSSSATYAVGDYCIYNGKLYRCTTAISTAEAWTAGHWSETNVDAELDRKVNTETGKGLSKNDYSDEEKAKVTTFDSLGLSVVSGAINCTANSETEPILKESTGKKIRDAIKKIAGAYDLTDYKSITAAVRAGDGDKIPNGTVFTVPHSVYGNIDFVVRRKNVDKVFNDATRPTLTIQTKYLLSPNAGTSALTMQFDRKESLCAAIETEIPANTVVKFTSIAFGNWSAGTWHFTATSAIPVGSYIDINKGGWDSGDLSTASVRVYANAKTTTVSATYAISSGDGDATVNLGTMGTELNHPQRVSYGSNNDAQSNILQFLNGKGLMKDIWVQKTKYDLMNGDFETRRGFLEGFPQDFLDCLGMAKVHNLTNDVYESPDSDTAKSNEYTYNAYFWLPSRKEIYGSDENTRESSESQFAYYADIGTTNADKLMYAKGASSPYHYWLRTPNAGYAYNVRFCYTGDGGALDSNSAYGSDALAPLTILA